jgi:arginyl-tRNA synthetase
MATATVLELESLLNGINLKTPIPQYQEADVLSRPLDIGRSYLAEILAELVKSDAITVYKSIKLSNDVSHGDFTAALPKLGPGLNAIELIQNVSSECSSSHLSLT